MELFTLAARPWTPVPVPEAGDGLQNVTGGKGKPSVASVLNNSLNMENIKKTVEQEKKKRQRGFHWTFRNG